jgi:hypothetical protein
MEQWAICEIGRRKASAVGETKLRRLRSGLTRRTEKVPFLLVEGDGIVIKGKGKERRDPPSPNSRRRHNKREKKETEKSDICFIVEISERCMGESSDLFGSHYDLKIR